MRSILKTLEKEADDSASFLILVPMNKRLLFCLGLLCPVLFSFGQNAAIPYGNNPAAGKYYELRGFKMYCETYGEGQPVLIIHGNGGSISNFASNSPISRILPRNTR